MSNLTSKTPNLQLSLFAPQFDSRIRRIEIDGTTYFSILDVFQYSVGDGKANPSQSWRVALKKLKKQGFDISTQIVDINFPGEPGRKTPIAQGKTFLRIAQVADIREWEEIRVWMADVAHERIEEMLNPGLGTARAYRRDLALLERAGMGNDAAAEHLRTRIDSVVTFKSLMEHIARVCNHQAAFGKAVNQEYLELFGKVAEELREILHTKNIRDALPDLQLSYIQLAEKDMATILEHQDNMTLEQLLQAVMVAVRPLGEHLQMICSLAGIDHVTGQLLLDE